MIVYIDFNDIDEFFEKFNKETAKNAIKINTHPNSPTSVTSSKFGGTFFLPKNSTIPTNEKGEQLTFLAQINCEELPKNDIYPKKGILQFWIFGGDHSLGADFENDYKNINLNKNKKVVYYPTIEEYYNEDEVNNLYNPQKIDEEGKNINLNPLLKGAPFALSFEVIKQPITSLNYEFDSVFYKKWNKRFTSFKIEEDWTELYLYSEELCDYVEKKIDEHISSTQIGGYPFFTQWDPRNKDELEDYTILLLQINSDYSSDYEILWGDTGVANFFIKKEQLESLDFSEVLYTWDCY